MAAYSQGGQVLHKAAALLPASTMEAVSSVVIFGDPGMWLASVLLRLTFQSTLVAQLVTIMSDQIPPLDDGTAVANAAPGRTLVICHEGDDICLHGDLILLPHLTYALNAEQAADFVASNAGY